MNTAFLVRTRDKKPFFSVRVSDQGSKFTSLTENAKELVSALVDEYKDSAIPKNELAVSLDRGMTIDGPMPVSALPQAIEKAKKEAEEFASSEKSMTAISVSDAPISVFPTEIAKAVISYKASAFISERTKTTFNYEVKRVRASWDPTLSIPGTNRRGGWRCPTGTRYGGQITDRFGRNCGWGVARRIANAITNIGERLEDVDDRRRGRRVNRRNERMIARLQDDGRAGRVERGLRNIADRLEGEEAPERTPAREEMTRRAPQRRQGQARRNRREVPVDVDQEAPRNRARQEQEESLPQVERPEELTDSEMQLLQFVQKILNDYGAEAAWDDWVEMNRTNVTPERRRAMDELIRKGFIVDGLGENRQKYYMLTDKARDLLGVRRANRRRGVTEALEDERDRGLRTSERRRVRREIEQPGAPRTDENAVVERRQRRQPQRRVRREASEQQAERTTTRRPAPDAQPVDGEQPQKRKKRVKPQPRNRRSSFSIRRFEDGAPDAAQLRELIDRYASDGAKESLQGTLKQRQEIYAANGAGLDENMRRWRIEDMDELEANIGLQRRAAENAQGEMDALIADLIRPTDSDPARVQEDERNIRSIIIRSYERSEYERTMNAMQRRYDELFRERQQNADRNPPQQARINDNDVNEAFRRFEEAGFPEQAFWRDPEFPAGEEQGRLEQQFGQYFGEDMRRNDRGRQMAELVDERRAQRRQQQERVRAEEERVRGEQERANARREAEMNNEFIEKAPRAAVALEMKNDVTDAVQRLIDAEQNPRVRAEIQNRWDLLKVNADQRLTARELDNWVRITNLQRPLSADDRLRIRQRESIVAFTDKKDAEAKLDSQRKLLEEKLLSSTIVRDLQNDGQRNEIQQLMLNVVSLENAVKNWESDTALFQRNSGGVADFFDPNAEGARQRREALGDLGQRINNEISDAINKRQGILAKYVEGRYGKDGGAWRQMTPEQFLALTPQQRVQYLTDAYSHDKIVGTNGKIYRFKATVRGVRDRFDVSVIIDEIDANGNVLRPQIGTSSRTIDLSKKEVYNGTFFISKQSDRGAGLQTVYNQHAFMYLNQIGVNKARVRAVDDGAFVWARIGYKRGAPEIQPFQRALLNYSKFGPGGLISNEEEYWRVRYLVDKANAGGRVTHQDFIFAVASSTGDKKQRAMREEQIKQWFKKNASFPGGILKFSDQRVGANPGRNPVRARRARAPRRVASRV